MKNITLLLIAIVTIIIIISTTYYLSKRLTSHSHKNNTLIPTDNIVSATSSLDEKTLMSLSQVSELILKNNYNEELVFKRPTELSCKKYKEVSLLKSEKVSSNIMQGALPIIDHQYTLSELENLTQNGLFTATVNPDKLSRFKDGTLTTMVRDNQNNLSSHAGFKEVDFVKNISPLAAVNIGMQAMAAVSGQYYLNRIFNNLDEINYNLSNLLEIYDNEKIAILLNAQKRISDISQRDFLDETDIHELRSLQTKTREVFYEYRPRFEKIYEDVVNFDSSKWQVEKRVSSYNSKIANLIFITQIIVTSERLLRQIQLTEIAARIKANCSDPTLPGLCAQLKKDYLESYIRDIFCDYDKFTTPITKNAEKIIGNGKDFFIFDKGKNKLLEQITVQFKTIEQILNSDYPLITKITEIPSKEQNILILLDENSNQQRVFLSTENEDII